MIQFTRDFRKSVWEKPFTLPLLNSFLDSRLTIIELNPDLKLGEKTVTGSIKGTETKLGMLYNIYLNPSFGKQIGMVALVHEAIHGIYCFFPYHSYNEYNIKEGEDLVEAMAREAIRRCPDEISSLFEKYVPNYENTRPYFSEQLELFTDRQLDLFEE